MHTPLSVRTTRAPLALRRPSRPAAAPSHGDSVTTRGDGQRDRRHRRDHLRDGDRPRGFAGGFLARAHLRPPPHHRRRRDAHRRSRCRRARLEHGAGDLDDVARRSRTRRRAARRSSSARSGQRPLVSASSTSSSRQHSTVSRAASLDARRFAAQQPRELAARPEQQQLDARGLDPERISDFGVRVSLGVGQPQTARARAAAGGPSPAADRCAARWRRPGLPPVAASALVVGLGQRHGVAAARAPAAVTDKIGGDAEQIGAAVRLAFPLTARPQESIEALLQQVVGDLRVATSACER